MNEVPNFKELKLWVAQDKIPEVLEQLVKSMPALKNDAFHNEVLSLASRWKQLGKNQQKGILSAEQLQLERNQITNSLLELLDQLDGKLEPNPPAISSTSTSLKKYSPYLLLLLLIPLGIWGIQQLLPTEEEVNPELEGKEAATSGIFTDSRDQQTYPWAIMKDGKKWMTKNLAYRGVNAYCYADKSNNCSTYGVLYTWSKAKKACPNGWHLPSIEEWDGLFAANGGYYDEANGIAVGNLGEQLSSL